jgi:hypothetical protein
MVGTVIDELQEHLPRVQISVFVGQRLGFA